MNSKIGHLHRSKDIAVLKRRQVSGQVREQVRGQVRGQVSGWCAKGLVVRICAFVHCIYFPPSFSLPPLSVYIALILFEPICVNHLSDITTYHHIHNEHYPLQYHRYHHDVPSYSQEHRKGRLF